MNQTFTALIILATTIVLVGLGKRPRKSILLGTDAEEISSLNSSRPSLLKKVRPTANKTFFNQENFHSNWKPPTSAQDRIKLQMKLYKSMNAGPNERLEAVQISTLWGHKSVLRFLRQGLKDSDSRVVQAAAEALSSQKYLHAQQSLPEEKPPRNVALIR